MENFHSIVASYAEPFFGLNLDTHSRATTYFGFRGDFSPFEVPHCHGLTAYAGNSRIEFFDHSGCVFGVVDVQQRKILWQQRIGSPGDLKCLWADSQDSVLRVQLKKSVYTFDILTGAQTGKSQIVGTLHASGPGYEVVSQGKNVTIRTRTGERQFKSVNGIRHIRKIGSVITIVEWQGPARVIDVNSGTIVFEAVPEPGSQFSQLHYPSDGNGPVILTQHFFDQPILTDVRFYDSPSASSWSDSTIGMSGNHAILSNGQKLPMPQEASTMPNQAKESAASDSTPINARTARSCCFLAFLLLAPF